MRAVRRLLGPIASSLIALLALEAGLRIGFPPYRFVDPETDRHWELRCRASLAEVARGGVVYRDVRPDAELGWRMLEGLALDGTRTNSRGFRGELEPAPTKASGTTRIVALGDSFTFGYGVADDEVYCAVLQSLLRDAEVINLGANGYGTDQQYLMWQAEGARLRPDVVLLGFFVPDFHRNALAIRELPKPRFVIEHGELRAQGVPVPSPEAWLAARGAASCRPRMLDFVGAVSRKLGSVESRASFEGKLRLLESILHELDASIRAAGARLAVVVIPDPRGRAYARHELVEACVERTCHELGVPLLGLTDPLAQLGERGVDLYGASSHWTPGTHRLAAERIAELLRELGWAH